MQISLFSSAVALAVVTILCAVNLHPADASSPYPVDCVGISTAFAHAASAAAASSFAFASVCAAANAEAHAVANATTSAAIEAILLTRVTLDANRCISAEAAGFGEAIASAFANASSWARAVATASGNAYAAAQAAAAAQAVAQDALCSCPGQVDVINNASMSLAQSHNQMDTAVHAWASAKSVRDYAVSEASKIVLATSQSTLQFCSSCGKGPDVVVTNMSNASTVTSAHRT